MSNIQIPITNIPILNFQNLDIHFLDIGDWLIGSIGNEHIMTLSLALATHNEEINIEACIASCKGLVDEVIVVDGSSTDKTAEIAHKLGARVLITSNPPMFHINKQKAIDAATGDWILQLDADERVSPELAEEIKKIISMTVSELGRYQDNLCDKSLFLRHQELVQPGVIPAQAGIQSKNTTDDIHSLDSRLRGNDKQDNTSCVAFFIPRLNFFLGKYLRYGGVYPDGVIRLFKKGKAHLPCKDVHEIMEVEGRVGWLQNPLKHIDSPTFSRYLERNSRYIDLLADELKVRHSDRSGGIPDIRLFFDYMFFKPISWFLMTTFRHKGILDGWQGVVFSFFSALRFPRAYLQSHRLKP